MSRGLDWCCDGPPGCERCAAKGGLSRLYNPIDVREHGMDRRRPLWADTRSRFDALVDQLSRFQPGKQRIELAATIRGIVLEQPEEVER